MARWHHRLDGHGFGWTPGVGDGQGGLACCDSWGCKESDTTEQLNWTELNWLGVRASEVQDCLGAPGPHGKTGQWPWSTQGCFCVTWSRKMSSCWHFSGKWNRCRKYSQRRYHPLEALAFLAFQLQYFYLVVAQSVMSHKTKLLFPEVEHVWVAVVASGDIVSTNKTPQGSRFHLHQAALEDFLYFLFFLCLPCQLFNLPWLCWKLRLLKVVNKPFIAICHMWTQSHGSQIFSS